MVDLITGFIVLAGGAGAAEWVRLSCRRRLTTPIPARRAAAEGGLQLQR